MSIKRVPRRSTQQTPSGYIWGRKSPGNGPVELLNLADLLAFGLASKASASGAAAVHGFGFSIQGRPGAGQVVGIGSWALQMTFTSAAAGDSVVSSIAATSTATFNILALISGVFTQVGTIVFAAGSTTGAVAFAGGFYQLPANTQLKLVAPASQDATLADISGLVYGVQG